MEGQYILKNLLIIAAALVVGGNARRGNGGPSQAHTHLFWGAALAEPLSKGGSATSALQNANFVPSKGERFDTERRFQSVYGGLEVVHTSSRRATLQEPRSYRTGIRSRSSSGSTQRSRSSSNSSELLEIW